MTPAGRSWCQCVGGFAVVALVLAGCSNAAGTHPRSPAPPTSAGTTSATSTTTPPPATVAENELPGTPNWRIANLGSEHDIEGWADAASVLVGEKVRLHVSTPAASYTVHAIRIGWYGGADGREVWSSPPVPGAVQPAATVIEPRHTAVTDWPVSLQVDTTGWPAGDYLLRLDSSAGPQRYVPLQVRRPSAAGTVVVVSADTTWQAYNRYGGYSLYEGPNGSFATRARAVSFDRPYSITTGQGASEYMENMRPLVTLVEQLGLDADYVSDVDLEADPHVVDGAAAVVMTGHDEYWSLAMRQALLDGRGRGTNLAFLGANSGYRHIRFEPSTAGAARRIEVCYKVAAEDPLYGKDNADVTDQWRNPPDPRPESAITGVFYQSNPVQADMVVVDPAGWMLQGTGAAVGTRVPSVVAPEYDRVDLSVPTPRPIEIVTHSPLTVHGSPDFSDSAYYTTDSGAGAFATGTIAWINSLQGASGPAAAAFTTQVTKNVLLAFAAGPAGRLHPAQDNVATFPRV